MVEPINAHRPFNVGDILTDEYGGKAIVASWAPSRSVHAVTMRRRHSMEVDWIEALRCWVRTRHIQGLLLELKRQPAFLGDGSPNPSAG